jgi:hypothetical protein
MEDRERREVVPEHLLGIIARADPCHGSRIQLLVWMRNMLKVLATQCHVLWYALVP